jgi:hypothetical protein
MMMWAFGIFSRFGMLYQEKSGNSGLLGFPLLIVFSKSPENEAVFYLCAYVDT